MSKRWPGLRCQRNLTWLTPREYMVTTTGTHRIVTDHLGSPRLVIDASTGAIAQPVDYDEWGEVASRTGTLPA